MSGPPDTKDIELKHQALNRSLRVEPKTEPGDVMHGDDEGPPTKDGVPGEVLVRQMDSTLLFPDNARHMEGLSQRQVTSTLYSLERQPPSQFLTVLVHPRLLEGYDQCRCWYHLCIIIGWLKNVKET